MTVSQSLRAAIVAGNTAAGGRVGPQPMQLGNLDPRALEPTITYLRVSTQKQGVLEDPHAGSCNPRFQIDYWSPQHVAADNLREQVVALLEGFVGVLGGTGGVYVLGIELVGGGDQYESETQLHHLTSELMIPYRT